jgi:acetyl esterase/lipase
MTKPIESLVIEPHTQAWLDTLDAQDLPPLSELSPHDARDVLRSVQTSVSVPQPAADIEDRWILGGPSGEVHIRMVRPRGVTAVLPVIIHLHGGGWVLGDKYTHERLYRELANAANAAIIFVDYTPAPEAQYPTQNEQAWAALEWAATNGREFDLDGSRIALVGDSAGGNIAAALTLMAKRRQGPQLAAQVLFYPVTDANFETDTYQRYADGPWLTRATMEWFWDAYLPDEQQRMEITASPLQASLEELRDLPPALIISGEHDVLCAEGEAFARKLSQAGVPVTQVRYGGTIHDFVMLNPITNTPAPRAAIAQAANFLNGALNPSVGQRATLDVVGL